MRSFPAQYDLQPGDVLNYSHIPKTAGMTFRTIVEDHFHCHEICPATIDEQIDEIPLEQLQHYRLFRGHLGFIDLPKLVPGKRLINVNIVREPVARVISHYEYIRRTPTDPRYDSVKDIGLEGFAEKLTLGKFGKNMQTYRIAKVARFHLNDLTLEETLALAKDSLDQFAFVGPLERFQDSLFLLSYIFGWKPILNSRKENAAKQPKTNIPEETLALIQEQTQLDRPLYTYALEIFEQRFEQMLEQLGATSAAPEVLLPLLEAHAEQRYLARQIPAQSFVYYDFCQPLRGHGWQKREMLAPGNAFRWMGPGTQATLDLPLAQDQDLVLECCVVDVLTPEILQSLTLRVNAQTIPLAVRYHQANITILQGQIPRSALTRSPFTLLTFTVDRAITPQTLNPNHPDARPVGVAFQSFQVFPSQDTAQDKTVGRDTAAFLFQQPTWQAIAKFMQQNLQPGQQILAPTLFQTLFPDAIPVYCPMLPALRNYNPELLQTGAFDWVIVHKGMKAELGAIIRRMGLGFVPRFANEEFIVLACRPQPIALPWRDPHVKALYVDAVKYWSDRQLQPLKQPLKKWSDRLRFTLKQRLSPKALETLKDITRPQQGGNP
ncbi:MAG: sulfotransferase family 2 domain-containing protein [Oculatellaceae cyanobacterium Prado106]|jgi:hypothetical protein|nr:sulfotransferase family 2 domain-containing protein [Oculatellaceae cyanobacterium Prado106]